MVHRTYKTYSLHDFLQDSLRGIGETSGNNFPFYNISEDMNSSNSGLIELALAGYSKDDIKVEVDNNILKISHKTKEDEQKDAKKYLHKGITKKSFVRQFSLGQYWEVQSVKMEDGILSIYLTKNIPEEKQPKVFDIR